MTKYIVIRSQCSRNSWDILDTRTRHVVEGGFSSRSAAQEYIWREYEPPQDR
jgi:hypothetical protein